MKFTVLTLFPQAFSALGHSVIGKALEKNLFEMECVNIRDYSKDKHRRCDDAPFGGGNGMIMTVQPLFDAVEAVDPNHTAHRIYLSPKGKTLTQKTVKEFSKKDHILFVCGSYEGVDERFIKLCIDEELSVGDFILTGGELAAMIVINATARYIPDVLGNENSADEDSFCTGLLEYPQYTRPQEFHGECVPDVLLSGNHGEIEKWRNEMRLKITKQRRPDLLSKENKF